jgi:hypothetical protein
MIRDLHIEVEEEAGSDSETTKGWPTVFLQCDARTFSFSKSLEHSALRLFDALEIDVSPHQRASNSKDPHGCSCDE